MYVILQVLFLFPVLILQASIFYFGVQVEFIEAYVQFQLFRDLIWLLKGHTTINS